MSDTKDKHAVDTAALGAAIRQACNTRIGVLDAEFMCRSVGTLQTRSLITATASSTVAEIARLLRDNRTGCVVLLESSGAVSGIFSERDLVLKITEDYANRSLLPVSEFMTAQPITIEPETTIAFALNLMSQGGFRHIPIVDARGHPVSLLSVRDVVDAIVGKFMEDVLAV